MARLSEYNFELCKEICIQVAEGKNIKKVLASKEKYPHFATWCEWKREHNELADLYVRSIQDKAESIDSDIEDLLAEIKSGELDPASGRLIIDTLKWKSSKYYPKMFGEKVDVTTGGEKIKGQTIIWGDKEIKI